MIKSILLMIVVTFFTSVAQILYKFGVINGIFHYYTLIGIVLYGVGAILFVIALKNGELSVLFPIIATSYIWVGLLSFYFFDEGLGLLKWIGIILITFGVIFVGVGSKDREIVEYTEAV